MPVPMPVPTLPLCLLLALQQFLGASPLLIACERGHMDVVRALLAGGSDVSLGKVSSWDVDWCPSLTTPIRGHRAAKQCIIPGDTPAFKGLQSFVPLR